MEDGDLEYIQVENLDRPLNADKVLRAWHGKLDGVLLIGMHPEEGLIYASDIHGVDRLNYMLDKCKKFLLENY